MMRKLRAERKSIGNNVTGALPKCYTEIEIENRDRDKEIEIDIEENQSSIDTPPTPSKPKPKKEKPVKHKYGEFKHVMLTDDEKSKLENEFGFDFTQDCITYLDESIEMKGYKYKSHYLAIRKWVIDAVKKKNRNSYHGNHHGNTQQQNINGEKVYTLSNGKTTTNYFAYVLDQEENGAAMQDDFIEADFETF